MYWAGVGKDSLAYWGELSDAQAFVPVAAKRLSPYLISAYEGCSKGVKRGETTPYRS